MTRITRREALAVGAAAWAVTIVPRHVLGQGQTPPSEKLNIAGVGVGGMGSGDIRNVAEREHRGPVRRGPARAGPQRQAVSQGEALRRFPQDARDARRTSTR